MRGYFAHGLVDPNCRFRVAVKSPSRPFGAERGGFKHGALGAWKKNTPRNVFFRLPPPFLGFILEFALFLQCQLVPF